MSDSEKKVLKPIRVAVAQLCSTDDIETNFKVISDLIDQAGDTADIISFPENSLYIRMSNKDDFEGVDLSSPWLKSISQQACKYKTHIFLGSLPRRVEQGVKNSTIMCSPNGDVRAVYDKINLFDVDVRGARPERESDYFKAGDHTQVVDVCGWKVGLSVCFDLRFSNVYWEYARQSVDILMVPSAFLVPTGRAHWEILLRARAIESQSFVLAAAQGGVHQSVQFEGKERETYGHSLVVAPWGNVLLNLERQEACVQSVELDPQELSNVRRQIPMKR